MLHTFSKGYRSFGLTARTPSWLPGARPRAMSCQVSDYGDVSAGLVPPFIRLSAASVVQGHALLRDAPRLLEASTRRAGLSTGEPAARYEDAFRVPGVCVPLHGGMPSGVGTRGASPRRELRRHDLRYWLDVRASVFQETAGDSVPIMIFYHMIGCGLMPAPLRASNRPAALYHRPASLYLL